MRTNCVYIDTETCGFHGLAVLIQYAFDDGDPVLYDLWLRPVHETLALIESFMGRTVVMFNAAFDHFHLCKIYTTFRLLDPDSIPANLPVLEVAEAEKAGRDGPCLKPAGVVDLMLHSRKGQHQSLMSRHDVRVRKVPVDLAQAVCDTLTDRVKLDPILSARWGVYDHKTNKGDVSEAFRDVVLRFRPNRGLKSLAKHCLGLDPEFHTFKEIWPERESKLGELGYAPYALACGDPKWRLRDKAGKAKGYMWPHHIHTDIMHWSTNEEARRYARDDVTYTRLLDEYFGFPAADDDDSVLACMVAAVRWHGFKVDLEKTAELLRESREVLTTSPLNVNKPSEVRAYIREAMDDTEALLLDQSTKKANLEKIRDRMVVLPLDEDEGPEICIKCLGDGCVRCRGEGTLAEGPMVASERADEILKIKAAVKEADQHAKLLQAGRFHASFKVIGTLSSRMAGGDGLNAQGIKKSEKVRRAFPLAWEGMTLCGGDFDSFEVTLADAVFKDTRLRSDLLSGLSIHTVMAQQLYPEKSFEQILASKEHKDGGDVDMYTRGKQAVFAMLYGGDQNTINKKLAIKLAVAEAAFDGFQARYPGVAKARERNAERFGAMKQPGGLGTEVTWETPAEYCETFLGFRRYFSLENEICRILYNLANDTPADWKIGRFVWRDADGHERSLVGTEKNDFARLLSAYVCEHPSEPGWADFLTKGVKPNFEESLCERRKGKQTLAGAASSAIYGAAFQVQAANIRAANNHLIQSPGAQITKRLQCVAWELQPIGVREWRVAPFQCHDEVMVATDPKIAADLAVAINDAVEGFRKDVPLIGLKWVTDQKDWGERPNDDDPRILHMLPTKGLDDSKDPETDTPKIDEPFEEWVDEDD